MPNPGYVYILASERNGTLYVGVTSDLGKRVYQHKNKEIDGFTKKYEVDRLVYYEIYDDIFMAITREKQLKKWRRRWKLELIESVNPEWRDLSADLGPDAMSMI
jgi:putative endonuclease